MKGQRTYSTSMASISKKLPDLFTDLTNTSTAQPPTFVLEKQFSCSKQRAMEFFLEIQNIRKTHPLMVRMQAEPPEVLQDGYIFVQAEAVEEIRLLFGLIKMNVTSVARRWHQPGQDRICWVANPVGSSLAVYHTYQILADDQQEAARQCTLIQRTWISGCSGLVRWFVVRTARDAHVRSLNVAASLLAGS